MRLALLLLLAGIATVASADEAPPPPPTLKAEASLSYVRSSGNRPLQTLGVGCSGVRDVTHYRTTADGEALYTSRDNESTRRIVVAGTFERVVHPRFNVFARGAYLDEPKGAISRQTLAEGGVRWFVTRSSASEVTLAGTLGRAFETPVPDGSRQSFTSAGLRLDWKLVRGTATFSQSFVLQDDVRDMSDVRASVQSGASLALNRVIGFKVSHRISYVRQPASGRLTTDQLFLLSLFASYANP